MRLFERPRSPFALSYLLSLAHVHADAPSCSCLLLKLQLLLYQFTAPLSWATRTVVLVISFVESRKHCAPCASSLLFVSLLKKSHVLSSRGWPHSLWLSVLASSLEHELSCARYWTKHLGGIQHFSWAVNVAALRPIQGCSLSHWFFQRRGLRLFEFLSRWK